MRKSTLILVAIAIVVVGFVYWFEFKRTPTEKTQTNPSVFHFQPEQVDSVTFSRPGQSIVVARQGSSWQITQPVQTRADSSTITALLNDVTLAHSSRALTPAAGQLKSFGLAPAALTLEFQLKGGSRQRLQIGSADFSGTSDYAMAGASPQVLLIPTSVYADGNKTVAQLRDNSVLGISAADVNGFQLKTPSAEFQIDRAAANDAAWSIQKPAKLPGDVSAINQLLSNVANAKLTQVVSENAGQLARYGLAHPAISFQVQLDSGLSRTLDLGAQKDGQFYARDSSRNMIFLVPASLDKDLDQNLFDLRDKLILHSLPESFTRIDYHAAALQFSCGINNTGKWVIFQPASDAGKEVANWKIFNPLSTATAQNILPSPPASLLAALQHPAVVIALTRTSGAKKIFRISHPVGQSVYVSVSDMPGLFEFAASALDPLNFKSASDVLQ